MIDTMRWAALPSPNGFTALAIAAYASSSSRSAVAASEGPGGGPPPRAGGAAKNPRRPRLDRLRPLGRVAQDEHGLAQRRRLFLEPTRVAQHEVRRLERADQVEIAERLHQLDA